MNTIALIVDYCPPFLQGGDRPHTLVTTPLGTRTALDHMIERCRDVGVGDVWVVRPSGEVDGSAVAAEPFGEALTRFIRPADVVDVVARYEPSDMAVLLDVRYWPSNQFDLGALFEQRPDVRWSAHAVCIGRAIDATMERIEQDTRGQVCRIQRVYDLVTWPRSGPIAASLIPMSALSRIPFGTPGDLRVRLVRDGFLSCDASIASHVVDVTDPSGLLALSDKAVTDAIHGPPPSGFVRRSETVLVGARCQIHPSARLIGPVVVHDHAIINRGATMIGPVVIGGHARVGENAVVAQGVVWTHGRVPDGAAVRHTIVNGSYTGQKHRDAVEFARRRRPRMVGAWEPSVGDIRTATDERRLYLTIKWLSDTILASIALVVLSPLFLLLAIGILLDSRGSVFYRDKREGKDGREFDCLKFRSMSADAHRRQRELYGRSLVDGPQFKVPDDPRVTRMGRLLRATNLDEVPQLINVAMGQMSLVGPRPSPFRENQICVPWRRARLSVRPGITGLWQICRHDRDAGDFHQWIAYDIAYVRNMSFWLDVKILLATVLTLGGRWSVPAWLLLGPGAGVEGRPGRAAA